jgi:hypothetical protein
MLIRKPQKYDMVTYGAMTFSKMTLIIPDLFLSLQHNDTQHKHLI